MWQSESCCKQMPMFVIAVVMVTTLFDRLQITTSTLLGHTSSPPQCCGCLTVSSTPFCGPALSTMRQAWRQRPAGQHSVLLAFLPCTLLSDQGTSATQGLCRSLACCHVVVHCLLCDRPGVGAQRVSILCFLCFCCASIAVTHGCSCLVYEGVCYCVKCCHVVLHRLL